MKALYTIDQVRTLFDQACLQYIEQHKKSKGVARSVRVLLELQLMSTAQYQADRTEPDHKNYSKVIDTLFPKDASTTAWLPGKHRKLEQYGLDGKYLKTFDTPAEAAKAVGAKGPNLYKAASDWSKTCKGYKWKWADESDN